MGQESLVLIPGRPQCPSKGFDGLAGVTPEEAGCEQIPIPEGQVGHRVLIVQLESPFDGRVGFRAVRSGKSPAPIGYEPSDGVSDQTMGVGEAFIEFHGPSGRGPAGFKVLTGPLLVSLSLPQFTQGVLDLAKPIEGVRIMGIGGDSGAQSGFQVLELFLGFG